MRFNCAPKLWRESWIAFRSPRWCLLLNRNNQTRLRSVGGDGDTRVSLAVFMRSAVNVSAFSEINYSVALVAHWFCWAIAGSSVSSLFSVSRLRLFWYLAHNVWRLPNTATRSSHFPKRRKIGPSCLTMATATNQRIPCEALNFTFGQSRDSACSALMKLRWEQLLVVFFSDFYLLCRSWSHNQSTRVTPLDHGSS